MSSTFEGNRDTWTASTNQSTASSDVSSVTRTEGPFVPSSIVQGHDQWRQEPMTAPVTLPWDWTFKSLWTATDHASRKRKAPELNIPSTILFHSGDPTHWLATDYKSGRLIRIGFPKPPKTSGGGKQASRELRLRAAWDGLLRFSEQMRVEGVRPSSRKNRKDSKKSSSGAETKESKIDPTKEPIVIAWYRDGGREMLDLETWSRLMGHRTWRIQLTAIQGYVHPSTTMTGNYVALQQIDPRTRALPMKNPAMDAMSKKLAQYCESAHTHKLPNSDDTAPSLRVIKLQAEYTIDVNGKLWYTHCSSVVGQEMAPPAPDPVQQAAMSVQLAAEAEGKLRKLLRMAANRGVDLETSFRHFDPDGKGAAHPSQFVAGIRKLGIALPPAAAELLLARLGRNDDGLITVEDFGAFVYEAFALAFPERSGTAQSSLYMESAPIDPTRMGTAGTTVSTQGSMLGSVMEEGMIGSGETEQGIKQGSTIGNIVGGDMTIESAGSTVLNVDSLRSLQETSSSIERLHINNQQQHFNVDGGGSTMSAIPIDNEHSEQSLTTIQRPGRPPPGHSSTFSDDMLPSWARPAAQEALIELQKRQIAFEKDGKSILLPNGQVNKPEDKSGILEDAKLDAAAEAATKEEEESEMSEEENSIPMLAPPPADENELKLKELKPAENIDLPENTSVYEIDPYTTVQYRILDHHDQLGGFDGTTDEVTGEGLAEAAGANLRGVAVEKGKDDFSVVVLPDFFDSVDTLQQWVEFLFVKYPRARILLVGFPGQPGTRWPMDKKLNNEFLASALRHLFEFLRRERLWHWRPRTGVSTDSDMAIREDAVRRCVLMIGTGNGANVATYYVTHYSRLNHDGSNEPTINADQSEESEEPLTRILRCIMLVNMFSHLDKGLMRALKRMIRLHTSAVHAERVVNLAALMFSSRYMEENTRHVVLKEFYKTRHPPKSIVNLNGRDNTKPDIDTGALALIRGALAHVDLRSVLPRLLVPTLLVHASENAFVLPAHAEALSESRGGGSVADKTIESCLSHDRNYPSLHLSYLRSGHVIFQERDRAMRMLIENMANCIEPALPVVNEEAAAAAEKERLENEGNAVAARKAADREAAILAQQKLIEEMEADDEEAANLSEMERKERVARNQERLRQIKEYKDKEKALLDDKERLLFEAEERKREFRATLSKATIKGMEKGGMDWVEQELEERGLDAVTGSTNEIVTRLDQALRQEAIDLRENMDKLRNEQYARDAAEAERKRKEDAILAKRRKKEEQRRKEAADRIRAEQEQERMEVWIVEQRRLMAAEDKLSNALRQQHGIEERSKAGKKMAKKYAKEMDIRRLELNHEKEMERQSMERSELRDKRRKRVAELKKQYEQSEVHLSGDDLGYGFDATIDDLSPVQDGCDRLCKDMGEIRGRKKDAMERHEAAVKKRQDTEDRVNDIERKLRDCRRAIRDTAKAIDAAKKRGRRLPNGRRITAREFKSQQETRRKEKDALNTYRLELEAEEQEYLSLRKNAREETHAVAGSVQRMTIVQKTNEKYMTQMIDKLLLMQKDVAKRKKQIRRDDIRAARQLGDLMEQHVNKDKRMALIKGERERCTLASTQYIDSMVFNHFKQRIRVSALMTFLDEEIATTEVALHQCEQQLIRTKKGQKERMIEDDRLEVAKEIIDHELKIMLATRDDAHISISDIMKRNRLKAAKELDAAGEEEKKRLQAELAKQMGATSLADKTRLKKADERTAEERSFIALDLVLHPELYIEATEEDLDIYKYDKAYHTRLTKKDLQRIVVLPEALNLALPFLRSREEINAHQTLRKYLFEQGEERLRERDANLLGQEKDAQDTISRELLIEKVKKRNLRAKLRATPKESLSGDEGEWLKYDRILHPHLFYGAADVGFEPPNVDERAAGEKTKELAPTRRGSNVPILAKLNQQQLLWLRSCTPDEIINECNLPFAKKRYRSMRGTSSQLIHIRELLFAYGWDEWDAPKTEEEMLKDAKERELEILQLEGEKAAGGTQKVQFSLKLKGLKLATIKSSYKSKIALSNMIAEQFQVPKENVIINNLSAGSVIIDFHVNAGNVDEEVVNKKVSTMLDDHESGLLGSTSREALRPILGDELVKNVSVAEITDIMVSMSKKEVEDSMVEDDAITKAKKAAEDRIKEKQIELNKIKEANDKKAADRLARREARKKKKAESIERKKNAEEKRKLDEAKRSEDEEELKKRTLDPLLHPVKSWISAVKQDINYEDPRYQFGDPIPATHPGGVHVQIISAIGIRAADVSFTGKGSSDPFVKVIVGENAAKGSRQIFKTKVIKNTLMPHWNPIEEFDLWREPPTKEQTGLSELCLQVYDYDKVGANDFLGEVRININDLPLDKMGRMRPPGIKFNVDADGARLEKLKPKPGKKDKNIKGSLQFRAWKTPSMAEREKVRTFLSYEKEKRLEARREQRQQKMIQKLEREKKLAAAEKNLAKRQYEAELKHKKKLEEEEKKKLELKKKQEDEIKRLDEEERILREELAKNPTSVINNVSEVPDACRRGPVIVRKRKDETPVEMLVESPPGENLTLAMRESRWHEFHIPENMLCTQIKLSVVYKGVFTARGYILGRLAVGLYRVPENKVKDNEEEGVPLPPIPVGYSPASLCELNTPDGMGRICITHEPSAQYLPCRPGRYRIVMAAASKTSYSFTVMCTVGHRVPELIKLRTKECQDQMKERPQVKQELHELTQSVRLSERKYRLVEGLIAESEQTCESLQREIGSLNAKLKFDANKDGLTKEQAREIDTGIGRLEIEFASTVKNTMSRRQELKDITSGLDRMMELKRAREDRLAAIDRFLEFQRKYLAPAAAAAISIKEASNISKIINARFVAEEHLHSKMGKRAALEAVHETTLLTPAQKLRRRAQNLPHAGLGKLDPVESRWIAYDRVRCPEEWELYSSGEEDDDEEEDEHHPETNGSSPRTSMKGSDDESHHTKKKTMKPNKKKLKKPEVPWTRQDLIRIYNSTKKDNLPPQEAKIKKMMTKFHDRRANQKPHDLGQEARLAYKAGGKQRAKLTPEQLEFLLYDRVLHPAWYEKEKEIDKFAGVDGNVAGGDGLVKRKGGYQKGMALMRKALKEAEQKGNLAKRGDPKDGETKDDGSNDKEEENDPGVLTGPDGQEMTVIRERPDPEKPSYEVLLISATRKMTRKEIQHQKDGHDPNLKFKYKPLPNLTFVREDLKKMMESKNPPPIPKDVDDTRVQRLYSILKKYAPPPIHETEDSVVDRRGTQGADYVVINQNPEVPEVDTDIDKRCRRVLEEIDLSFECTAPYMRSSVMHSVPQMFPIDVLRADLERELDRLLCEQVFERERATKIMDMNADPGESGSDSSDEDDTDEARALRRRRRAAKQMRSERLKNSVKVAGAGYAAGLAGADKKKADGLSKKVRIARELKEILISCGEGAHDPCLACRTAPCAWVSPVDYEIVKARRVELDVERERLRSIPKSTLMVESFVAKSVTLGGNPQMTREALSDELESELAATAKEIFLHNVDNELHAAYCSTEDYFETEVLHGFKQMQATTKVLDALESERNRIIADILANQIVDNILDWMLEGWYFGERESEFPAVGYVPSLRKEGPIRLFEAKELAHKKGLKDRGEEAERRGVPEERDSIIAKDASIRSKDEKAIRAGSDQEQLLNQTEKNLKFGIFSLTLQYFRSMTLVRRQYDVMSGKKAAAGLEGKKVIRDISEERKRMDEEQNMLDARLKRANQAEEKALLGMARRQARVEKERGDQRENLRTLTRTRLIQRASAIKLQAVYRGHIGRLAAMKWAVKKAEIDAMRALQHAAAVAIERVWRGVLGRAEAEERRIEMAEFIAQMRAAEAAEEEEEYWRVHTWERYKRDFKAWWRRVGKPDDRVSNTARLATEAAEAAQQRRKFEAMEQKLAANYNEYDDENWEPEGGTEL